jgi:hypothetical protein
MVLNILGDWYLAENQSLGNLEFFNRIGQKPTFTIVGLSYLYWQLAYPGGDPAITHWVVNTCQPSSRALYPLEVL